MIVSLSMASVAHSGMQKNNCKTDIEVKDDTKIIAGISNKSTEYMKQTNVDIRYGYTTENVNVRTEPSFSAEIYGIAPFDSFIVYKDYDENWVEILNFVNGEKEKTFYMSNQYFSDTPCGYEEYSIPDNNGFKSYMSHKSITDKTSNQYTLQKSYAYTGDFGIRKVKNRYCIAIGTAFNTKIGDYVDLILENGEVIPSVVSDIKADKDTDSNNIATIHNGCVSEFVVDAPVLADNIAKHGDISVAKDEWNSKVVKIKIYDKNILNLNEGEK